MHQRTVMKHAAIAFLTLFVLFSCALMAYAEENTGFNGRRPEPYTSVYEENAGTKTVSFRRDGAGLYDQLRAYYAPYESEEASVGFRLMQGREQAAELWEDTDELTLENGQEYVVEMAVGYRGADGQTRPGMFISQPQTITAELFCSVTVSVTGEAEDTVTLNDVPATKTMEVFDYEDAVLCVGDVAGYACQVLVDGVPQHPDEAMRYHLGELRAQTAIEVLYSRTNVQCGTPAHATLALTSRADSFVVTVTPDAGYAVAGVRVNGAVQTDTVYSDGVAQLTMANGGEEAYFVTADIVQEKIAANTAPTVVCRAGWEDALTKAQVFAAVVDAKASVPANLTADDVEIEYQADGPDSWTVLGDAQAARLFGEAEQEWVRIVYPGSADGQYPAFTSEEILVTVDRQTRDIWLEQPAHASMSCEKLEEGAFLITVTPDDGYAVEEITAAEGRDAPVVQKNVTFMDGTASVTLYRVGEESYTVAAQIIKERLAVLESPAVVLREGQDYTEQELRERVFAAAVDTAGSVPAGLTADDVEIRYLAQEGAAAAGGVPLDYRPAEGGGHAFGEKAAEHIYITYHGSGNGQYRAMAQELDLLIQKTRSFHVQMQIDGAAPEQGGAVLFTVRGGESHVIEDGKIWEDGETVLLSVQPIVGYRYEVAVNGTLLPTQEDDTYTLGVLAADTLIRVSYMPVNMSIEDAENAAVRIAPPDETGRVVIQADPADGYAVTAVLLNGEALQDVTYDDGVAFAALTPEQALLECRISVQTAEEGLAVRSADLSGYEAVPPAELKRLLFESVLDAEQCVPVLTPETITIEYCASVEIPSLGWSGELWLPAEAGPQDALQKLPGDVAAQLGEGAEGIKLRRFGRQANETLRICYQGSAQYRPFAREITVRMPDHRAETELRLRAASLTVEYGCTEEELRTQLLALVEGVVSEGEAVPYTPEQLTVDTGGAAGAGTHTAVITYQGDEEYKNVSVSVEVTVAAGAAAVSLRVEDVVTYGEQYEIRVRTSSEDLCYAQVVACTKGDKRGYICITLSDSAKEQMKVTLPGKEGVTDLYKTAFSAALEGSTLTEAIESLEEFCAKYGSYLPRLQLENIIELLDQIRPQIPLSQCRVCLDDTFTQTGDYFVGVITVDANYTKAKDTTSMTIQRNGSGVSLEWNNQGKVLQIMSSGQAARTDFGATLYDENVRTTNKAVKNSVVTFCAGMTFDKQPYISSVGPEDAGVYVQGAFVVNSDYESARLFRGIVILKT